MDAPFVTEDPTVTNVIEVSQPFDSGTVAEAVARSRDAVEARLATLTTADIAGVDAAFARLRRDVLIYPLLFG